MNSYKGHKPKNASIRRTYFRAGSSQEEALYNDSRTDEAAIKCVSSASLVVPIEAGAFSQRL